MHLNLFSHILLQTSSKTTFKWKAIISIVIVGTIFFNTTAAGQSKPNILFIPVDDLRPELGCYGNKIIQTPNIDKLAKNGIVFNRAYCQQAVCNPSRASLLTGLRPDSLKVWDLYTDFRSTTSNVVTLPQYFKSQGYSTIGIGKAFHNIFPDSISWSEEMHVDGFPFDPDAVYADEPNLSIIEKKKEQLIIKGEDRRDQYGIWYIKANATENGNVDDDAYYDGAQTTMAINKLKSLSEQKEPFFLSVGYYKPHLPFTAPKKYWDLYNEADMPIANNAYPPINAPLFAVNGDVELRNYDDQRDLPKPTEPPLSKKRQQELIHGYYASVSYMDAQIGRLMKALDSLGLTNNTIVVFWGDHGWKLGEHNSWAKQTNYEIDTRVPLIVSGKNVQAKNTKTNALVEFVDIYPSLCDMAELPIPKGLQGKSFYPLTSNPEMKWKKAAYSQFLMGHFMKKDIGLDDKMGYAIRTNEFRYVEWYEWHEGKNGKLIAKELYDEIADPEENKNIESDPRHKSLIKEMSQLLSSKK